MITLFKVFGIEIWFHFSSIFLFLLLAYISRDIFTGSLMIKFLLSAGFVLIFISNMLIHELAHAIVMGRIGIPADKIVFFLLGAAAHTDAYYSRASQEFKSSIAGIMASGVLVIVWYALYFLLQWGFGFKWYNSNLLSFCYLTAIMNFYLIVINLIPAFPTDGGRLFRASLWYYYDNLQKATAIASAIGQLIAILLIIFSFTNFENLWYALIGLFIFSTAWAENYFVKTGEEPALVKKAVKIAKMEIILSKTSLF